MKRHFAFSIACSLIIASAVPASAACYFLQCAPEADPVSTPPVQANPPTAPAPRPTAPGPTCGAANGDFVVVGVKYGDPDGGLHLRSAPGADAAVTGVIPGVATGVEVGACRGNWCETKYGCQAGWSNSAFLAPSGNTLQRVVGVSPSDPEGLNLRTGPHHTYAVSANIPYNATGLIVHICQASQQDGSRWCLVTYDRSSGWVSGRYLAR